MAESLSCLLVIPCYRDEARLKPFLVSLVETLPGDFTICISDDGSGEQHQNRLVRVIDAVRSRAPAGGPVILDPLLASKNAGKGAAVYRAWRERGEGGVVAFADADGAVSAKEILRLWTRFTDPAHGDFDALFASRILKLGRRVERRTSRHYAGRVFATCVSMATGIRVYDSQCGLKFIRRAAFETIEPLLSASRFAFDVELLMALTAAGFRIEEAAVDWRDVPDGKVSVLRDALPMLSEVLRIRKRMRKVGIRLKAEG